MCLRRVACVSQCWMETLAVGPNGEGAQPGFPRSRSGSAARTRAGQSARQLAVAAAAASKYSTVLYCFGLPTVGHSAAAAHLYQHKNTSAASCIKHSPMLAARQPVVTFLHPHSLSQTVSEPANPNAASPCSPTYDTVHGLETFSSSSHAHLDTSSSVSRDGI